MKNFVIIVAGGSGTRMKSAVPKQFHLLLGKPMLQLTMQAFIEALSELHLILVVPKEHLEKATELNLMPDFEGEFTITTGGVTRFESVQNGLRLVPNNAIVFVHDGVRCLLTPTLVLRCLEAAKEFGNAVPAIAPVDSIRVENETGNAPVDRRKIRMIQTPQTFRSELLKKAYARGYQENFTDDASVLETMGEAIHLVEGEHTNIKITLPLDIIIAEEILKERALESAATSLRSVQGSRTNNFTS